MGDSYREESTSRLRVVEQEGKVTEVGSSVPEAMGLHWDKKGTDASCWARGRDGPVALALTFPFLLLPMNAGQEPSQFSTLCLFLDLMREDEEPLQMCVSPLKALRARHGHPMGKLGK